MPALLSRPPHSITAPLRDINPKPNHHRGNHAHRKQEGEPLPVVSRLVDDDLYDIGPYHGRGAVEQSEETEELVNVSERDGDEKTELHTMFSKPGGLSSAIIVREYA